MAITEHRLIDSTKRALVKYVSFDTALLSNSILLDVSTLSGALNNSGNVMVANTGDRGLYRTTIKRIYADVKSGGSISLHWAGANNSPIAFFGSGAHDLNFENMGEGAVLTNPEVAGATGDILLSSLGIAAGDGFTLIIDVRKDNRDYDAGQSGSPLDFNKR